VSCMRFQTLPPFEDILANLLSELPGFSHLTTFVFKMPHQCQMDLPTDSERALSLATGFINANPTLTRVAFQMRDEWTDGMWPCYIRAQAGSDSDGDSTAVFEGFDILGRDSWRDV
jgi:hypothetical protein